jgi:hypothetical protein
MAASQSAFQRHAGVMAVSHLAKAASRERHVAAVASANGLSHLCVTHPAPTPRVPRR